MTALMLSLKSWQFCLVSNFKLLNTHDTSYVLPGGAVPVFAADSNAIEASRQPLAVAVPK